MPQTYTTEQTGKRWKGFQAGGVALMLVGVGACFAMADSDLGMAAGSWAALLGLGLYLAGRVGAWWYHAAIAGLLLAGCGGDSPAGPDEAGFAGFYELVAAGGSALPVAVDSLTCQGAPAPGRLLGGSLTIEESGAAELHVAVNWQDDCAGDLTLHNYAYAWAEPAADSLVLRELEVYNDAWFAPDSAGAWLDGRAGVLLKMVVMDRTFTATFHR